MPDDTLSTTPLVFGNGYLQSRMNWQIAVGKSLMLAQCQQLEMMTAWLRSISAVQHELMDHWICRFGGGVPLDGWVRETGCAP